MVHTIVKTCIIAESVDKILVEEDDNDDGYLSYAEYVSNRRTTIKLQQAAKQMQYSQYP